MMKSKNLMILLMVTILLVAFVYYRDTPRRIRSMDATVAGAAVFPDVDINRVAMLAISDAHAKTTVHRSGDRWQVSEKHGYAADFRSVRDLLLRISDLKIGRPLHLDDGLRRELHLVRPGADGPGIVSGMHIVLSDAAGKPLATLTLGKTFHGDRDPQREPVVFQWHGADGRYVKTHTGDAFLVSDPFQGVASEPDEWLDRRFLEMPAHALVALEWRAFGRNPIRLSRQQPGDPWQLQDAPEDKVLDTQRIDNLIRALRTLRFDDIADPSISPEKIGLSETHTVTLKAHAGDGRQYELLIGDAATTDDPALYPLRVSAAYELPPTPMSDTNGAPAKDRAETIHQHVETVQHINERLHGWIYLIDADTAEKLRVTRNDLLTEPEPPGEPDDPGE